MEELVKSGLIQPIKKKKPEEGNKLFNFKKRKI
jgi:hypothetical protein